MSNRNPLKKKKTKKKQKQNTKQNKNKNTKQNKKKPNGQGPLNSQRICTTMT